MDQSLAWHMKSDIIAHIEISRTWRRSHTFWIWGAGLHALPFYRIVDLIASVTSNLCITVIFLVLVASASPIANERHQSDPSLRSELAGGKRGRGCSGINTAADGVLRIKTARRYSSPPGGITNKA